MEHHAISKTTIHVMDNGRVRVLRVTQVPCCFSVLSQANCRKQNQKSTMIMPRTWEILWIQQEIRRSQLTLHRSTCQRWPSFPCQLSDHQIRERWRKRWLITKNKVHSYMPGMQEEERKTQKIKEHSRSKAII